MESSSGRLLFAVPKAINVSTIDAATTVEELQQHSGIIRSHEMKPPAPEFFNTAFQSSGELSLLKSKYWKIDLGDITEHPNCKVSVSYFVLEVLYTAYRRPDTR